MANPQRAPLAFTLRAHLLAFAAAILLPVSVLTAALLFNSAQLERTQIEARLGQVVDDLAEDTDRYLSNLVSILQTLATSPALQAGDLEAFHLQASAAARNTGASVISLVDPYTMQQTMSTLLPWGADLPTTGYPEGIQRVRETGRAVVSNYFIGSVTRAPAWNVEIPVFDGDYLRHVLVIGLTPAHLWNVLQSQRREERWVTAMIDGNGVILARSRDHQRWSGMLNPRLETESAITTLTVYRSQTLEGDDALRALQRLQVADWIVTASVPVAEAEAPLWRSLAVWFAVTLGTGVLTLFLALQLSGVLTRPITEAARAARALGRGDPIAPLRSTLFEANEVSLALANASHALAQREAAQRRWEDHQRLLLAELSHRVKNSLAVVQALALRTLTDGRPVADARESFVRRLHALSRAHELLVQSDWRGAPLREIMAGELALFADRVRFDGPEVLIKPTVAQTLALVIHELGTNAIKYGALQVPEGQVTVQWAILPGDSGKPRLRFTWSERGGPRVTTPEKRGFGSVLLERAVAAELHVKPALAFAPEGFRYELEVPLEAVAASERDLDHDTWADTGAGWNP